MSFHLLKKTFYIGERDTIFDENCPGPSNEQPYIKTLTCAPSFDLNGKLSFNHNDT